MGIIAIVASERAPMSVLVGSVGVAYPADAIWTRHNRPQHRAVPGPPRRRAGTPDADDGGNGVSLGNPSGTGKNQGRNLRVHNLPESVISCRYRTDSGKIKKQRVG